MADLVITASSVVPATGNNSYQQEIAGEASTAGAVVYKSSNGKWYLAQCDGTTEEAGSDGVGILLNNAAADQPISVLTTGDLTLNAVLTAGVVYVLSNTDGKIMPIADFVTSTWKLTIIGYATTTTNLRLLTKSPGATGVALA